MREDNDASLSKQYSRRLVAEVLLHNAPQSRAGLARATGLSKQTTSLVIADLEAEGWVRSVGVSKGAVGRTAVSYDLARDVALSLGVDLGGTKLSVAIADLVGKTLAEATEPTDRRGGAHVLRQVHEAARKLAASQGLDLSRARSVVVGMPGVVDPATGAVELVPNIRGLSSISAPKVLADLFGQPVAIENDVNLAMLGEAWQGCAQGAEDAAFLALGTGVGLGLIVNGRIARGARGAAGEIAYLPIGRDLRSEEARSVGAFELEVGAAGILRLHRALGGDFAGTVRELFDRLAAGDGAARGAVDETACTIALAITAIAAIVDPELVVLGGSIGARPELLNASRHHRPLFARAVDIRVSALGARAGLVGALSLAVHRLHNDQFGMSSAKRTKSAQYRQEGGRMSFEPSRIARLRSALDEDEALALLKRAIGAASVTGAEKGFADLLAGELVALGAAEVVTRDFAPGRPNVWGVLAGEGGGPRLLMTGHTDTVHVRGWTERWAGDRTRESVRRSNCRRRDLGTGFRRSQGRHLHHDCRSASSGKRGPTAGGRDPLRLCRRRGKR